MQRIIQKLQHDTLFLFTTALVLIAACFGSIHFKNVSWETVESLLALLGLVTLLQSLGFIEALARFFIEKSKTSRDLITAIFLLSFFSAMVVTNDVAILTIVPLTFAMAKKVTFPTVKVAAMATVYANLGSAISPIGNPQNIFLLAHYQNSPLDYAIPAAILTLLALISMPLFIKHVSNRQLPTIQKKSVIKEMKKWQYYLLGVATLVILAILISHHGVLLALILTVLLLAYYHPRSFREVDYGVVLSIMNFFLLVGALMAIPSVKEALTTIGEHPLQLLGTGILLSQVISNVPVSALLAPLTSHASVLYLAVSVGAFGTLIASLANLLAFRQVKANAIARVRQNFILHFTYYNVIFLVIGSLLAALYVALSSL
ncbi:SLC13 family permease [Fructobacillus durionis]|uniref:Na+/H+ antiporter NhaD n=1 Tax=Fructobacillus durionis TaxID=283737 RepID=A0A1I1EN46_9LACO|nr:SLC13 family permease [Fructobacillus durionis]SFB88525.1 Na+/H+ antiporter NhaD [Fructobacillus durionis]